MKNLLVFDASTSNVFTCGVMDNIEFFFCNSYEKSKLSREIPNDFIEIEKRCNFNKTPEVIIGYGPGSFTGIKTACSFFLAFLYANGINKIHTVSSSRLIASLFQNTSNCNKIVLIPFNKGEYFLSVLDNYCNILLKDTFLKYPYENIEEILSAFTAADVEILLPVSCGDELIPFLKKIFNVLNIRNGKFVFNPDVFYNMNDLPEIDISHQPFIINHVIYPANIDKNCNLYVAN